MQTCICAQCQGERGVVFTRLKVGEARSKDYYLHSMLPVFFFFNNSTFKLKDAGTNLCFLFYRFILFICVSLCMYIYATFVPVSMGPKRGLQIPLSCSYRHLWTSI